MKLEPLRQHLEALMTHWLPRRKLAEAAG